LIGPEYLAAGNHNIGAGLLKDAGRETSEPVKPVRSIARMDDKALMFRMNGMPRAQGCAGAAIARLAALVPRPRLNLTRFHSAGESDRTSCAQRKQ